MRIITFLATFIILLNGTNAYANNAMGLEIEGFFNKIEELYNQKKPDMEKLRSLKGFYTDDNFIFKQETTSNLGEKVIFIELNREEYLDSLKDESKELSNSNISHTITDIRYSNDNKGAEVDYTVLFKGEITTEKKDMGLVLIRFFSLGTCTEFLEMKNDVLKSYKTECKTEILYKEPQPIKK